MTQAKGIDEESPEPQARGRSKGILITDGAEFTIPGLQIRFDKEGVHASHAGTSLRLDMCRHWLRIAVAHVADAAAANRDLLEADSSGENANLGTILEREFRSSMQATVSATIALDAFYAAIKDRIDVPQDQMSAWRKNKTARWKQMAEVFRLAFGLSDRALDEVRGRLDEAFQYRNCAIHPPADQKGPVLRDEIHVGVEWRLVAFRYKNAATIVQMALALVNKMLKKEHPEPEALAKYCEGLRPAVDALIEAWSREYPSWPVIQPPEVTE
jgi:hypothetical protein